ncbi:malectin domain-containing carbohydrate-binding protein [Mucilaginibacter sp. RS28]|uniref:Malectin domain-containing carbohydrate-binding protein n=1 Tax=Mucilaginibacter straminoryzae TaxID=2932774 RepID=A0A9X1X365_9SPHI|nr:malectin domain-containing carbohydrate-binding protein [Mucilaginibacter straminoryzae]MCJ8210026.1 malectin domain-containing carbohydrate-binding protein [Mucilaginibacter straminoryzae]
MGSICKKHIRYNKRRLGNFLTGLAVLLLPFIAFGQESRKDISLNSNWQTIASEMDKNAYNGFEKPGFNKKDWINVNVPHNWDTYEGYRRLKHGNKHGYAWYTKTFKVDKQPAGKRYFLYFEGVSSYATIWLNGQQAGYHAGGRTTFTLDVTNLIKSGGTNYLAVRADHPAFINDLPWVCGGCSDDPGFSEGSQPMGIFRPVHLMITNPVRVAPFGVHLWNDTTVNDKLARINLETELKNYNPGTVNVQVLNQLKDASGKVVAQTQSNVNIANGASQAVSQNLTVSGTHLWSLENPYLYQLVTDVKINGKIVDHVTTPYGIRWISWPIGKANSDGRFYLNGKPVFINGIAEYEHLMGKSHAFSPEEIKARVMQVKAAGFNAFRDAHQPHNLEYQQYWDQGGILWWPQFSAHNWYDSPAFRESFKSLLKDWVKERRNSPSNILWGLQNESHLPEDFAKECSAIIRQLDPTASSQRKITTCNGGKGTDWDVPQNWTGTYGGDPLTYSQDLQKQLLVGEYGAWRSLDLHTSGDFSKTTVLSEDRMAQIMETKVRLAEAVKDKVAGHFQWLLYSHENPGRSQGGEGLRELDRIGPVNYKGLFTAWGQPLDVFYMYRSNYVSKTKEPMVYIVSHTWPNRWLTPGEKDSISVYSNCDEVELFNDVNQQSFGKKKRGPVGTHFLWNGVDVKYNVLYAVGYVNGKAVAKDYIVLNHLPEAPHAKQLYSQDKSILKPAAGYHYVYRVNCGGPQYKDSYGNTWAADTHRNDDDSFGSRSWTDSFKDMPAYFGSQQRTFDPIKGTADGVLFQTYRFGIGKLNYNFPLKDGDYRVELFFNEPWYGATNMNCAGWRLFDVAANGKTVVKGLDIWKEAGYNTALKKTFTAHVTRGKLNIAFPNAEAGEAIISAIAISSLKNNNAAPQATSSVISTTKGLVSEWLDLGDKVYTDSKATIANLPPVLYGASWIKAADKGEANPTTINANADCHIYIGCQGNRPAWLQNFEVTGLNVQTDENGGTNLSLYRKRLAKGESLLVPADQRYFIAALPVDHMAPATDLKKTVSYRADIAQVEGSGITTDTLNSRKVIKIEKDATGKVVFPFSLGVADQYALRVKYANTTDKTLTAKVELLAADGTIMRTDSLQFRTLKPGKTSTAGTTTGTSVNAGEYRLVITPIDAGGLIITGIEIQ